MAIVATRLTLLLAILSGWEARAFVAPSLSAKKLPFRLLPASIRPPAGPITSYIGHESRSAPLSALSSSTSAENGANELRDGDSSDVLKASVCVGAVTAMMGYLYGKVLSRCLGAVWTTLPALLSERLGGATLSPVWFITSTMTLGGILIGIISSRIKGAYTVADFVSAFSSVSAEARRLPQSRASLPPLLALSLLTSVFGFSLGPEAPMVCAGGIVGTSISRRWFGDPDSSPRAAGAAEALAYAGAAGTLTAFMGIPIAGSVFALEMTRESSGMNKGARGAWSPAVAASVAALALLRVVLEPSGAVGGHFSYGSVGALGGRAMMIAALICGVGGAAIGTVFHKAVAVLKRILWTIPKKSKAVENEWRRTVAIKGLIGLLVGILSSYYPQTLFWGEGSLQCAIDGQLTPFSATKHGLSSLLTSAAAINPSVPFATAGAAAKVGLAKLIAIMLACAAKLPGGIIFPLFFAAAPFAHAIALVMPTIIPATLVPVIVICLMASTQASVTRTPLASALILTLTASAATELSVMLPPCLVASYVGVWTSQLFSGKSYFKYSE